MFVEGLKKLFRGRSETNEIPAGSALTARDRDAISADLASFDTAEKGLARPLPAMS
ncbi:hypothetical protein HFN59_00695 [Rhizobium leguminosarum]|uniref:hypothetical protein n=1 Tax=Rhizobium leguminosarum TaxID=384 RepID=UPI001C96D2CF|nr:hypothetical protein [Rhizobium leguminosarum]MBY5775643.1 hypothetical protein [Rhizobium leguminosarum]